jgi:hypothetical protein
MTHPITPASDLTGTVDERMRQLTQLAAKTDVSAEWLMRQLHATLLAWADDETELDVDSELHADY